MATDTTFGRYSDLVPAQSPAGSKTAVPSVVAPASPVKPSSLGRYADLVPVTSKVFSDKPTTSIFKDTLRNFPSSLAENLPFGVGEIVKVTRREPETVLNLTAMDFIRGLPEAGKEILKAYTINPLLTVAGGVAGEIKFNVPGLGEVSNAQFRAAEKVRQGESSFMAALSEAPNAIFDTLFVTGLARTVTTGRPVTIAKGQTPPGIKVKEPPKSFRVYEEPTAVQPLTPEYVARMAKEKGVDLGKSYNPELPTYFRMTGKADGKITGEVVQIKPSYVETFINTLRGNFSKVPPEQTVPIISRKTSILDLENTRPTPPAVVSPLQLRAPVAPPLLSAPKETSPVIALPPAPPELVSKALKGYEDLIPATSLTEPTLKTEGELTLKPSAAATPEARMKEATSVFGEEASKKLKAGKNGADIEKPLLGKTELKTILSSSKEFADNPVLTVDSEKNLTFSSTPDKTGRISTSFRIKPEALGLNKEKLDAGDTVRLDVAALKAKGAERQMRVFEDGEVLASLASPRGNKTIRKILEKKQETTDDGVQEVPADFKISERAKEILKEFGVVSAERELPWRYLGLYKPREEKVRVRAFYDITTVTHEGIHAIDDQIDFTAKLIADTTRGAEIRNRLTDIYEKLYPTGKRTHKLDKRMKEGLAVLFENYFYDPATITAEYGDLVAAFIKPTGKYYNPLFTRLLDRMNELVDDYAKLSPEQRIGSRIRTGEEVVRENKGFTFAQRAVFEVFNRFEPLKRYGKATGVSETWDDPLVQAFNILNKNTIISNWVKGDTTPILLRDGNFRIDKGTVKDYLKLTKGKEKEWRSYLVARRVVEEHNTLATLKEGLMASMEAQITGGLEGVDGAEDVVASLQTRIEKLKSIIAADDFSLQDATAVVEKYGGQFEKAEKIYDGINKRLIDFSEENDLISRDTSDTFRAEKGYASFRRFIDDELDSVGTIKTGAASKVSSFKERTGSQLDIIDPVYSQIVSINEIVSKAMENRLWNKVDGLARRNPEVAQRFEKVEAMAAIDAKGRISFPQERDPNIIRFWKNGKREFRKAAPEFLAVQKTLRGKEFDAFVQFLRIPSSVFTRLTTSANPLFAGGNISVDQFSALTQTKTGFKPIIDPVSSLIDYIKGDEGIKAYLAIGGKRQTLASYFDLSPDDITHKLTGGETRGEKAVRMLDSALGVLEFPSNMSEIMTRYAEYLRAVQKGESQSVAMYRAAEVTTPFQLQGNFGGRLGMEYIRSIPYLNAIIQVLYKFGRTTKDNPKRVGTMLSSLLIAGLTSAIILLKYSNEKQKRLLSEQPARNLSRYLYFPSPNGEDLIRLRIPEQFGVFTGMAYLYTIGAYGGNQASFDDYLEGISSAVPEQINFLEPKKAVLSFLPQVLEPSVLVAANTKTYPEVAPIVPQFVKDQAPKEQYNAYTTKVGKVLGDVFDVSPMLVDFWIKQQFGAVGSAFIGKIPGNPLYIQEDEFVMSGRSYNRFYDNRTLIDQQYQEMVKKNSEKYNYKEKVEINEQRKLYGKVSDMLSDMRKINQAHDLPEDIRSGMYDLLLELDSKESLQGIVSDAVRIRQNIDSFMSKNKIK